MHPLCLRRMPCAVTMERSRRCSSKQGARCGADCCKAADNVCVSLHAYAVCCTCCTLAGPPLHARPCGPVRLWQSASTQVVRTRVAVLAEGLLICCNLALMSLTQGPGRHEPVWMRMRVHICWLHPPQRATPCKAQALPSCITIGAAAASAVPHSSSIAWLASWHGKLR